mgnify:CR=1 FL=1
MIKKKLIEKEQKSTPSLNEEFKITEDIETGEVIEKKEELTNEEINGLREEIEKTNLDESLASQVEEQAQNIKSLKNDQKIKKLLEIADDKGVVYAVNVAKKMDDPYILDTFHDALLEKGYYKKSIN